MGKRKSGAKKCTPPSDYDAHMGWMRDIPDQWGLMYLSLPGTHISVANKGLTSSTQVWDINRQYQAGVRFVDITCMVHHGLLVMCHGLRKFGRLLKLLMDTAEFLRRNPSETVLVHLNIQSPLQRTKFLECFQSDVNLVQETYTDCVWLRESIPRLGEVRGRIVMLQDFTDSEGCGIPWSVVHTSGIGTRVGALWKKWDDLLCCLEVAVLGDNRLHVTFTAGAGMLITYKQMARRINPQLQALLESRPGKKRWGVLAMDVPSVEVIDRIINSNFMMQKIPTSVSVETKGLPETAEKICSVGTSQSGFSDKTNTSEQHHLLQDYIASGLKESTNGLQGNTHEELDTVSGRRDVGESDGDVVTHCEVSGANREMTGVKDSTIDVSTQRYSTGSNVITGSVTSSYLDTTFYSTPPETNYLETSFYQTPPEGHYCKAEW